MLFPRSVFTAIALWITTAMQLLRALFLFLWAAPALGFLPAPLRSVVSIICFGAPPESARRPKFKLGVAAWNFNATYSLRPSPFVCVLAVC